MYRCHSRNAVGIVDVYEGQGIAVAWRIALSLLPYLLCLLALRYHSLGEL